MRGSNRARQYDKNLRNGHMRCPGPWCECDLHEGITDHLMSRVLSKRKATREIADQLASAA